MQKLLLSALKNGTGVAKEYEDVKYRTYKKKVPAIAVDDVTGEPRINPEEPPELVTKEVEVNEIKRVPKMKTLNWFNVVVVGNTDTFHDVDMVIERVKNVTWEDIWRQRKRTEVIDGDKVEVGIYENLQECIDGNILPDNYKGRDENSWREGLEEMGYDRNPETPIEKEEKTVNVRHDLYEAWCYYDLNGDGIKEPVVFTILDGQKCIRKSPNPFYHQRIPYLFLPLNIRDNDKWGIGACEQTNSLQYELNSKRNQFMDNATMALNNMWITSDRTITDQELVNRPNGVIYSRMGVQALQPVQPPIINQSQGIQSETMIKDDMTGATAATKSLQGEQLRKGTATEVKSMTTESNFRILLMVKNIQNYVLRPYLEMQHSLNQQFVEEEETIFVKGDDGQNIPVSVSEVDISIDWKFDFLVVDNVENKIVKIQQLQNYLQLLSGVPLPPNIIGPAQAKLMKMIWIYMNIPDAEDVLPPDLEDQLKQMMGEMGGNPAMPQSNAMPTQRPNQVPGIGRIQ
jgi:hypothetical protein